MAANIPTDRTERKRSPVASGVLDYFPDAIFAIARLSVLGNDVHNPGEPLHWSKEKSNDHADCAVRHLMERGKFDLTSYPEAVRHSTMAAWRALANLQIEIEQARDHPDMGGTPLGGASGSSEAGKPLAYSLKEFPR